MELAVSYTGLVVGNRVFIFLKNFMYINANAKMHIAQSSSQPRWSLLPLLLLGPTPQTRKDVMLVILEDSMD